MIAVFKQTFRDLYRERILYNVFFMALFLIFVGYLASLLVFGHQERVILHFGTSATSLAMLALSMTIGGRVIRNEIEQRTVYLALSRPISRPQYLIGKSLGVSVFLLSNLILLTAVVVASMYVAVKEFRPAIYQWMILTWVESLMVLGASLALSFSLRSGINAMIVMTFLFLSHNHEQMALIEEKAEIGSTMFNVLSKITPNGSVFFLDTRVYYDLPIGFSELFMRCGYGMLWALAFFSVANALFYRRNI